MLQTATYFKSFPILLKKVLIFLNISLFSFFIQFLMILIVLNNHSSLIIQIGDISDIGQYFTFTSENPHFLNNFSQTFICKGSTFTFIVSLSFSKISFKFSSKKPTS